MEISLNLRTYCRLKNCEFYKEVTDVKAEVSKTQQSSYFCLPSNLKQISVKFEFTFLLNSSWQICS